MALFIGNIHNTTTADIETKISNYSLGLTGRHPIYGVQFSNGRSDGVREFTAQNLRWEPSTASYKGKDDFVSLAPFNVRECITDFDSATGKRKVLGYKGDSNWADLVAANTYNATTNPTPTGDRMIEFPKFYYKRPQRYEWLISPDPVDGFLPSPMHFRNGVLHDTVRISKYALTNYRSWQNIAPQTGLAVLDYVTNTQKRGQYNIDYAATQSLVMLMMVKYANMDIESVLGDSAASVNGQNENLLGLDGKGTNVSIFGIDSWLGQWAVQQGGICQDTTNKKILINTDIEHISSWSVTEADGWQSVPAGANLTGNGNVIEIAFDESYPWCTFPTKFGTNSSDISTGNPYMNDYFTYTDGTFIPFSTSSTGGAGCFGGSNPSIYAGNNTYIYHCVSFAFELG
jgi:hypothetical protein